MAEAPEEISPVDLILQGRRVVDILLGDRDGGSVSLQVLRSQRLPLPYWILKYTFFPAWSQATNNLWFQLHISESGEETAGTIDKAINLMEETSEITIAAVHSWYDHIWIEVNRLVESEPYIYMRYQRGSANTNPWTVVRVMLQGESNDIKII